MGKLYQGCNTWGRGRTRGHNLKLQFVHFLVNDVCCFPLHTAEAAECEYWFASACACVGYGCVAVTLRRVWCMHVFLLSVEGVEKHLFNLVYNWIWPMGMPHSSERWQQMRRGWKEVAEGQRRGQDTRDGSEWVREQRKRRWHMDGRWGKCTEVREGRCGRRLREDAGLHSQSSVRLHKDWVHGRVAGSQVNMTYEYCRSHSLPSCPPQLLMSGSELAQLLLEAFLSTSPENKWETQTDGQTDIKTTEKREPARQGEMYSPACREQNEMRLIYSHSHNLFLQEKWSSLFVFCSALSVQAIQKKRGLYQ